MYKCKLSCRTYPCSCSLHWPACILGDIHRCSSPECCSRYQARRCRYELYIHQYLQNQWNIMSTFMSFNDSYFTFKVSHCPTLADASLFIEIISCWTLALKAAKSVYTVPSLAQSRQLLALVNIYTSQRFDRDVKTVMHKLCSRFNQMNYPLE